MKKQLSFSKKRPQNAQESLEKEFLNKNQVKEIKLSNLNFEQPGELLIDNYSNLKAIYGNLISNLTKITITNCPQLEKIDIKYLKNNRELILHNLPNLKELVCFDNNLTSLDLTNFPDLQIIYCWYNQLIQIKLPLGKQLEELSLYNNNLNQDLSFLRSLVNLKELYLSNNKFKGSLEPLQNLKKLKWLDINDTDIDSGLEYLPDSLEEFYCLADKRKDTKVKVIYDLFTNEQGKVEADDYGIKNFPQKLQTYKQWIKFNFAEEEIKAWISAGAAVDDYEFVTWLRDVKGYGLEWILNYKEDYKKLNERFKKYGLCSECNQPNTGEKWCKDCNSKHSVTRFSQLNKSKNQKINEFIQKYQLQAAEANKFIEWIPYKQFVDVEFLAEGGFSKVYKAKWMKGNINHWDMESKQWKRITESKEEVPIVSFMPLFKKTNNYKTVVLKSLNNSSENIDFLQETEKHKIIDDWFNNIIPCYGLSQDPNTENYLMVMQYMPEGNLRKYLSNKNKGLSLKDKLSQLLHIARGLKDIHTKNLVHRDFHSGNILKGVEKTSCLITDLGLCKPVNEANQEDKVFGVLSYVAPEVLLSQPYTQAADVYSFGIVSYEMLSGLPPYYDQAHDVNLGIRICRGLRPQFNIKIPQLLEDLIKKCWDADLNKRPNANELERILRSWEQDEEFKKQLQEAEKFNKTLSDEVKFPRYKIHKEASYHSKLLPTKEITKLLQSYRLQNKTSELNERLTEVKSLSKKIDTNQNNSSQENLADALAKALNRLLNKSQELTNELEKIIATNSFNEEAKKALRGVKDLKTKLIELQKDDNDSQKFEEKKIRKEKTLKELKDIIIANNKLNEDAQLDLNMLLENQKNATKNNNDKKFIRQLEKSKKELKDLEITEEEINQLCQLQKEITELEIKLQQNVNQKTQQLTQIINNIGFTVGSNSKVGNVSLSNNEINNFQNVGQNNQQIQIIQQTNLPNFNK